MSTEMPENVNTDIPDSLTDADLLTHLASEVAEMRAIVTAQVEMLGVIKDMVQPTLDTLTGNPMFRMLFGGDK